MKKLLLVFAIAGSLVACNNAADSTAEAKDSVDSVASETKDMVDFPSAKDDLHSLPVKKWKQFIFTSFDLFYAIFLHKFFSRNVFLLRYKD